MGPEDTEVDEQFGYRFGYHRAATVGVNGVRRTTIAVDGVVEEVFRHGRVLGRGDQPAGDIARKDIENDVAFVPHPLRRSFQCGDIPGPHLAGAVGGPGPGGWPGGGVRAPARRRGRCDTSWRPSTSTGLRPAHGPTPGGSRGRGRPGWSAARAPGRVRWRRGPATVVRGAATGRASALS